ncbi:unnamed protein product [Fraxinus pennsylvanica]|uniref:Uncharacterized protein n=1 Tax=Fraxinus pennsylvanica TaxID=56036 RepID=A0AAD1YLP4_9LAMI|nr:unnamed protein product [Fraxinus pennsylvanica]
MHRTWNPWLHLGRTRTRSPMVKSEMQIAHPVSKPGRRAAGVSSEGTKLEHLSAHLIMEFNPSEQIKAHKRTDRTITTFASNVLSLCSVLDGATAVAVDAGGEL